jgi:FlaA1/EpsC-like NDP-sugar epimerase
MAIETDGNGSWARRLARGASKMRADIPLAILDIAMVVAAYTILLFARFDFSVPDSFWHTYRLFLPVACVVHVVTTLAWGGYGRTWRHASIDEARRLLAAGTTSGVILIAIFAWNDFDPVPLSVLIAGPLLATFLMGVVRFQSRLFAVRRADEHRPGLRVAVVGSGGEAATAIREMQSNESLRLVPVVVVDDDRNLRHRSIHGVPTAGDLGQLDQVIAEHRIDQLLLAIPDAPPAVARRVADSADVADIPVRVLRASSSWVHGMPRLRDLRDLDIADLLRRDAVGIDLEPVQRLLTGKRVLVTGGGGWIGSEIARQVAGFAPASLILLDHDETHLHDAAQRGAESAELALVDIRDETVLTDLFERVRPEVVFHAAAHKHVPILEDFACEAVRTNVFGSMNLLRACEIAGSRHVVFISTDKAATPTSVMGASKWLAEQIMLARAPVEGYCAVRFGNVLGSRGSVIPTFQRQIAEGGPVTVTDRMMTRYFMSTDEAVRLVLTAAADAGDHKMLALEMGEQVNIYELAERMIRLCGFHPHEDVEIRLTGLRPGENVVEALIGPAERIEPDGGDMVMRIVPYRLDPEALDSALAVLRELVAVGDHDATRMVLLELAADAARPRAAAASAT